MTTTEEIGPAVAALVRERIDSSSGHADASKQRLRDCLPRLAAAIESWCPAVMIAGRSGVAVAYGPDDAAVDGIRIAAATSRNGTILHCGGWPSVNAATAAKLKRGKVVAQVANAIERAHENPAVADDACMNILVGVYLLLGEDGQRAYEHDAAVIAGTGGLPLIVLLADYRDGKTVSLVTTVGVPPPVQQQVAAIEAGDATLN
jgi:hypothetical protein